MNQFFAKIKNLGAAHLQHVAAIRSALQEPDTQTARDGLTRYLQGLSDTAVMGFHVSTGMLAGSESDPRMRQALQWIQANIAALRAGQFAAITPETMPAHGLSIEQVASLLDSWAALPPQETEQRFTATMHALDAEGRDEFAVHLDTLAFNATQRLEAMREQESNAWGTSFEDRIAYLQARITTGESDPAQSQALAEQQRVIGMLTRTAHAVRQWQASPALPAASEETHGPDLTGFPVHGSSAEQMEFMKTVLAREKARGKIDAARAASLEDFVEQATTDIRNAEARKQRPAADRAGQEADLREDMAHLRNLRDRMDGFRVMQRNVRREDEPPAGSRAAAVRQYVSALNDDVARLALEHVVTKRTSDAQELERLQLELIRARARVTELAASDETVLHYEADSVRPAAQALRLFHRRGHAMIARPVWSGGEARMDPNRALFAGPEPLRAAVASACASRKLELFTPRQSGVDQATWAWRCLQRAGVAIVDLSDGDPQTFYQLGQAYALGTELLLAAHEDTTIPFDVSQFILTYRSAEDFAAQLPDALDATLYGVQIDGLSLLMDSTLRRCRQLAEKAAGLEHAQVLLSQLEATVQSPLDFRAAVEQFLGLMGNRRLMLLHPRWPAFYPAANQRRCFVVMPFSEELVETQATYRLLDAELSAAGVEVIRGDEAAGQEIIASIWEETARASHVVVDLTGFNPNVCLELGMADAIGRDTLLIGAKGTVERGFPAIARRRIHQYGDDEASRKAICGQVLGFTKRPPTLQ